jgi:hypothetical protein
MNDYIQHTIPPAGWARLWRWNITPEQQLYIDLKEQEIREEEERLSKMSEGEALAQILGDKK